jgi:hypothetical protein
LTIKGISKKDLLLAAIPSIVVILISLIFDSIYQNALNNISNKGVVVSKEIVAINLWYYPIVVYVVFVTFLLWAIKVVTKKIQQRQSSETEVVKTIEKFSGLVDGIGTALPLIGAAVILFTIGLGTENQDLFLKYAVPFEIKSLFVLATAKLFESVFDEFELQVQDYYDKTNGKSNDGSMITNGKIEFVNLPTEYQLDEMNKTIKAWKETVDSMNDPQFNETLNKILKITGKS